MLPLIFLPIFFTFLVIISSLFLSLYDERCFCSTPTLWNRATVNNFYRKHPKQTFCSPPRPQLFYQVCGSLPRIRASGSFRSPYTPLRRRPLIIAPWYPHRLIYTGQVPGWVSTPDTLITRAAETPSIEQDF